MLVPRDDALPEGFRLLPGLLTSKRRQALVAELAALPPGAAGQRELLDQPWCQALAWWLKALPHLQPFLPTDGVAVQCTLFEKSPDRNWLVALHQDLAVPVAERVDHAALSGWSVKGGRHFVLAPAALLAQMVALRLHLDDATEADGGLRFVPGSHRAGVLDDAAVATWRRQRGEVAVDARAGDALLMRPLALHASSKATAPSGRRRVLHVLFGPRELLLGLRWHQAV
ncbi:phytanoyl-CoA dioxygenase family protein [Pelomonas sp. UHG3]|uniref:Phytanoyl-CoA dioxygenase family protein n=1 Tax=Roseateles hydrophilus TaxID=2975054 RepID=A0ACC6C6N7_9BURK|nr:phytanoyl-CoA dioxygenase family protein [Pelomonas sp. UHG3]MCY4744098.1 phytanoyl-CoA dioxygenase family protein [Pelomonas sp. UHG3]